MRNLENLRITMVVPKAFDPMLHYLNRRPPWREARNIHSLEVALLPASDEPGMSSKVNWRDIADPLIWIFLECPVYKKLRRVTLSFPDTRNSPRLYWSETGLEGDVPTVNTLASAFNTVRAMFPDADLSLLEEELERKCGVSIDRYGKAHLDTSQFRKKECGRRMSIDQYVQKHLHISRLMKKERGRRNWSHSRRKRRREA